MRSSTLPDAADAAENAPATRRVREARLSRVVEATGGLVALVGVLVLSGWALDLAALRQLGAWNAASINPLTAVCFVLCGLALLLCQQGEGMPRRAAAWLAGAAAFAGALRLAALLFGLALPVDSVLFGDAMRATPDGRTNQMAPATAASFLLNGASLLLLTRRARGAGLWAQSLAVVAFMLALTSLLGHVVRGGWFEGVGMFSRMARPSAWTFLILAWGVLSVRPSDGCPGILHRDGPGGALARKLLPAALVVPSLLGWAAVELGRAAVITPGVGQMLFVVATTVVFTGLVARMISELDRLDHDRRVYLAELEEARSALEARERDLLEANERLGELATRDGLTQLANRRVFDERLAQELARARRHGAPLALLLLDIDHFKAFNDQHGHLRGDEVLCSVATILTETIRETDVAARYGGEEFAVLLPDTTQDEAARLAERLRAAIAQEPWRERTITASIGVAAYQPEMAGARGLIELADLAMYGSKAAGRDRVTVAGAMRVA